MKCENCKYFTIVNMQIVCTAQGFEFEPDDDTHNIAFWCPNYDPAPDSICPDPDDINDVLII